MRGHLGGAQVLDGEGVQRRLLWWVAHARGGAARGRGTDSEDIGHMHHRGEHLVRVRVRVRVRARVRVRVGVRVRVRVRVSVEVGSEFGFRFDP